MAGTYDIDVTVLDNRMTLYIDDALVGSVKMTPDDRTQWEALVDEPVYVGSGAKSSMM